MKSLTTAIIALVFIFSSTEAVLSKEWRGITPLHSTRADVERLLGPPRDSSPAAAYYTLRDEIVVVRFQKESCASFEGKFGYGWQVPVDTVTDIGVIPRRAFTKDRFVTENDFTMRDAQAGFFYYTNARDGLSIETLNGTVTLLEYSPTEAEDHSRCPRVQECCIDFFPTFDEYGRLTFQDEKARLDNFVMHVRGNMGRAVLVIYGENSSIRKKLLTRAQQAKRYLVGHRALEPERVLIVDGGHRNRNTTELQWYPVGGDWSSIHIFSTKDPQKTVPKQLVRQSSSGRGRMTLAEPR